MDTRKRELKISYFNKSFLIAVLFLIIALFSVTVLGNIHDSNAIKSQYGEELDKRSTVLKIPPSLECGEVISESTVMSNDLTDCPGTGIIIGTNNTELDCNGHIIDGDGSGVDHGIYINGGEDITIKNCNIKEFWSGVYARSGKNVTVSNNNMTNIERAGFLTHEGQNNTIRENNIWNVGFAGVYLDWGSESNHVTSNIIKNNGVYGIYLPAHAHYNTIWNNIIISNGINAHEEVDVNQNNWNTSIGNYWSDFVDNPGYPDFYEISGPGDGIDHHPSGPGPTGSSPLRIKTTSI